MSELVLIANRLWTFPSLKQKARFVRHLIHKFNQNERERYYVMMMNEGRTNRDPFMAFYANR